MNLANGHYICPFSSRLCLILRGLFHNINSEPLPISMGQEKERKETGCRHQTRLCRSLHASTHAVTCYHCRSLPRWAARRSWVDGRGGFTSVNGLTETRSPMIRVEHLTTARFPPTFTRSRNHDVTIEQ